MSSAFFRFTTLWAALFVLGGLTGCVSTELARGDCPADGALADAERLATPSHHAVLTDSVLTCAFDEEIDFYETELSIIGQIEVVDAPEEGTLKLPVFLVILDPQDKILLRRNAEIEIDATARRFAYDFGVIEIQPQTGWAGRDYTILYGFRLNADQLAANRQKRRKKLGF